MPFSLSRQFFVLVAFLSLGELARAEEYWMTLQNCQLLPNPANDGDSFHIRATRYFPIQR